MTASDGAGGRLVVRPCFGALAPMGVFLATLYLLPLFHVAANRLVVGMPVAGVAALGAALPIIAAAGLVGAALADLGRGRLAALGGLALLSVALVLFASALGAAASDLIVGRPAAVRARLASGAWIGLFLLAAAAASASRRTRVPGMGWLVAAGLLAALVLLHRAGRLDAVSLAVEYAARAETVRVAFLQHIALAAASVALAAASCVVLALWRPARGLVDLAVNGVQVVPAVALLGALVALVSGLLAAFPALRALGVSGLGPGPAILAITAYLLLPLWRGLHAGLRAPDPATLDAADALGLTPRQVLTQVRLPLGAPILVGALRVASVQGIGLATLAALVGAGGLGTIVFDGMAQFAPDLILLGAIPVIALSLFMERGLSLIEDRARRRWRG